MRERHRVVIEFTSQSNAPERGDDVDIEDIFIDDDRVETVRDEYTTSLLRAAALRLVRHLERP